MASVQQTVIERIQRNPGINQTRTDALYLLLAVSGTGWNWVGGEVVDVDNDPRDRTTQFTAADEEASMRSLWSWMDDSTLESVLAGQRERFAAEERIASEAAERSTRTGFSDPILSELGIRRMILDQHLFDTFQAEKFLNVPADAKPDWVEAAAEVRAALEAEGFTF